MQVCKRLKQPFGRVRIYNRDLGHIIHMAVNENHWYADIDKGLERLAFAAAGDDYCPIDML